MKMLNLGIAVIGLASLMLCSCETTKVAGDHEPYYDYWSGACCPQHAHLFVNKKQGSE